MHHSGWWTRFFVLGMVLIASFAIFARPAAAGSMIGYWENWGGVSLGSVSSNYDVIDLAFGLPGGTDNATISWSQSVESDSQFRSDVQALQSRGKKVLLSIGGGSAANLQLLNSSDINSFVSSVENIVNSYGLNGIDLDLENATLSLNSGDNDFTHPTTTTIVNLITALNQLHSDYGSSFMLTFAPETVDVDAYGQYGGEWGSYLPVIYATRGWLSYVATQCYNSGSMYGLNGGIYNEGTPDFLVSQAELLLHGFHMGNGQNFPALAQSQVAFGIPATSNAAGSGSYVSPSQVLAAAKYLGSGTPDGGSYTLAGGPYPNFAGVMTWDIDYDQNNGLALSNTLDPYLHSIGGTGGGSGAPIGHTIAIYSASSGYYLSCNLNWNDICQAAWATSPQGWEYFTVVDAGNGLIALKSNASGYYVSTNLNNTSPTDLLQAQWATTPQAWEEYTWQPISGNQFALKSVATGDYVSCDLNNSDVLRAAWATTVQAWETFTYQIIN